MNMELLDLPRPATATGRCLTRTSEKYLFVPTEQIAQELMQHGWKVSSAVTTRTKSADRQGFQKHMVRFRPMDDGKQIRLGDSIAELLLVNSHDSTTSYQFRSGIFRMVCSNGMIVSEQEFPGVRVRHHGSLQEIIDASLEVASKLPTLAGIVNSMKAKALTNIQRMDFASAAIKLRHGADTIVTPDTLLRVQREADSATDLWTTFNVVQENIMRGGGIGQNKNGDFHRLRPVKGMDKNIAVNTGLWDLAAGMVR